MQTAMQKRAAVEGLLSKMYRGAKALARGGVRTAKATGRAIARAPGAAYRGVVAAPSTIAKVPGKIKDVAVQTGRGIKQEAQSLDKALGAGYELTIGGATNPYGRALLKNVALPVAIGGGMYALGGPGFFSEDEPMRDKIKRQRNAWLLGGGTAGGLLAHSLTRGAGAPAQLFGILAGIGGGAALGHETGLPATARYSLARRKAHELYRSGYDPSTGLPVSMPPVYSNTDPTTLHRMARWGI